MNKKEKNRLITIVCIIISICVGGAIMYGVMYFFPNTIVKTITKQKVSINEEGISSSVAKVYDSVVYVENKSTSSSSIGTGFVYKKSSNKAYIITNYHVVDGAETITIYYNDDTHTNGSYLGGDEFSDIAVLTVDASTVKGVAEIGKNEEMLVGDTVFAIGAPLGLDYKGTVTRGILSGKDRMVDVSLTNSGSSDWVMNVMQTDAAINPGNSGGPLCNVNGEVIGVNSMKIVQTEAEGLGFAIPIEDAINYATQIEKNKTVSRPYIGVATVDSSQSSNSLFGMFDNKTSQTIEGAKITEIEEGSPADKANMKVGDIVVKINDDKIESVSKFRYYLYQHKPGEKIKVTVQRDGKNKVLEVKLTERKN